ncbi:MAG: FG-GAP repeat protein [Rhodospirillales bacterium]|nr:MAG: FG-GAP repeat protein [Rhodospirillales bacterium]
MNKRYLKTLFLTLATLASLTLLPGGAQAAEEYVIPNGGTITINEHGVCTAITNNSGNDLMAPTKTANEWSTGGSSFLENAPLNIETLTCCTGGQQNLAYTGSPYDNYLGSFVAVDGNWAVSSSTNWTNGYPLHFFKRTGGVWSENQVLGTAISGRKPVDIDGDTVVVGRGDGTFVYYYNGTTWSQQGAALLGIPDSFGGTNVAIDGDTIVTGDNRFGDPSYFGRIYVYTRSAGVWSLQYTMTGASWNYYIGKVIALDGDTFVANYNNTIRVYTGAGATWSEQATLTPSPAPAGVFGNELAISGDTVVVGASNDNISGKSGAGSVYVFTRSGTTWSQQAKLISDDPYTNANFGYDVSISGDLLIIGEPKYYVSGVGENGRTHIFTRSGTTWTRDSIIVGAANANFGTGVDTDGLSIFSGAPGKDGFGVNDALYMDCVP